MDQVRDFFSGLLASDLWPARWVCGYWSDFHGWLYIISSFAIGAAYFFIPISLFYIILKRKKDIPFPSLMVLFSFFILSCGITHISDAVIFWIPNYRLHAIFLVITAIVSWIALIYLFKLLPHAMSFTSPQKLEQIVKWRTQELAQKNSDLMRLNKEMDNFIYSTSHDLKSPINNIVGLVTILRMELNEDNETVQELLNRIEFSSNKAISAIQNLTSILKTSTEPYEDIEKLSIQEIINEIMEENLIWVKESHADIHWDLKVPEIEFSRTGMKSILYNLIINAIKYKSSERDPVITIRTYRLTDSKVALEVQDNGLGIDMEMNAGKVFGLFKRFHDHIDGSGVGLYSIKKIVESKGGSIDLYSKVNEGSVFKLVFIQ